MDLGDRISNFDGCVYSKLVSANMEIITCKMYLYCRRNESNEEKIYYGIYFTRNIFNF